MSSRIDFIINWVNPQHQVVYDLCCDHGLIGLSLEKQNREVILIDKVPSIIQKLKDTDIPKGVKVLCEDATDFNYNPTTNTTFIIAGIGGHLAVRIIDRILESIKENNEMILCIHSHMEVVFDYLLEKSFTVLDEIALVDDYKVYELYKIKFKPDSIPNFGESLWENPEPEIKQYLEDKLEYFRLKTKYDPSFKKWEEYYQKKLNP